MSRRRKKARRKKKTRWRLWFRLVSLTFLAALGGLAWLIWPIWREVGQFGTHPVLQPSRLYGRSPVLKTSEARTAADLITLLDKAAYAEDPSGRVGTWRRGGTASFEIFRRTFPTSEGPGGGERLRVELTGGRITALAVGDRAVSSAILDPPLIASFYGPDLKERRPFASIDDELSEDVILAVLAIEDSSFLSHVGFSLTGILRAAWTNLMESEVRQGGSTLTQQLVKNLFLTHERTWTRKLREVVLAVYLELRYDKRTIFRAYLNEIFWGRSGSVNLMGVGASSWAYFAKEPAQLTLAEAATLAGMIKSPAYYSPLTAPERAKERRNVVLARLAQLNWVGPERLQAASREEVVTRQGPLVARRAPYFAAAMAEEARRRFRVGELRDAGYVLLSTLSASDQETAEGAVREGMAEIEKSWEKKSGGALQTALVSVDPPSGEILAYVGGRDYRTSQFDRVALARRQPGSSFKPVVFAAALKERAITPASVLEDAPFSWPIDGKHWSPKNSDGTYQGAVSARFALEKSLNVPTAKVAKRTGLGPIIELARDMGIHGRIARFPALSLGSMEVTPLEMATVYGTLANGGLRPEVHGLRAVRDRQGRPVAGTAPKPPVRVLEEDVAFLVSHLLQGVFDRGTGRSARRLGLADPLAGKTGTTNSRRDSWFAGYSPDRATLVWVGYDDNSKTRLSGARAALPIWTRFSLGVRPAGGFARFDEPDGIVRAWIDPSSGGLATARCPEPRSELFLSDFPPGELCRLHPRGRPLAQPDGIETPRRKKKHPFRDLLRTIRGKKKST